MELQTPLLVLVLVAVLTVLVYQVYFHCTILAELETVKASNREQQEKIANLTRDVQELWGVTHNTTTQYIEEYIQDELAVMAERQDNTDNMISHINSSIIMNSEGLADHKEILLNHTIAISNNTQETHDNQLQLQKLTNNVTANRDAIEHNTETIKSHAAVIDTVINNTQAIASHQEMLNNHANSISDNTQEIHDNKLQLLQSAEDITANREATEQNAKAIKNHAAMIGSVNDTANRNTKNINALKSKIQSVKEQVNSLQNSIQTNGNSINSNEQRIETNEDDISDMRDDIDELDNGSTITASSMIIIVALGLGTIILIVY